MTRQDYYLIVRVIRVAISRNLSENETKQIREAKAKMINEMVEDFEREFKHDNPRFKPNDFRRAIFGGYSLRSI